MYAATWMNLENTMIKEARHKRAYVILFCLYEMSKQGKSKEMEGRLLDAWVLVVMIRLRGKWVKGTSFLLGVMKMF
jgi:hypothetical protein